ncbi:hypothetical protein SDC9_190204 [bioreactor metagenome]|uniref:Uncharacterized protein n=1 Tax=bioreactor metagenome TaxID=1076179 RepID=A0A645HUJ7_9ZZZZ
MFTVSGVVAGVDHLVPGVADRAPAPGEEQFFEQGFRLHHFVAVGGVHRGFTGDPWLGDVVFLPHRQENPVEQFRIPVERAVFVIAVDIEIPAAEPERLLLESPCFAAFVFRADRGEAAGGDLERRINRLDGFIGGFQQFHILFDGEIGEASQVRLVPHFVELIAAAVALRHRRDVFAPGVGDGELIAAHPPV